MRKSIFAAAGGGRLGGGGGNRGRGLRGAPPGTGAPDAGDAGAGRGAAVAAPPIVIGYARQFRIDVSMDGNAWQPVAEGSGTPLTTAAFTPTRARYVRITQTGDATGAPAWVVQNLRIYRRD
jgi:hypothetical protein